MFLVGPSYNFTSLLSITFIPTSKAAINKNVVKIIKPNEYLNLILIGQFLNFSFNVFLFIKPSPVHNSYFSLYACNIFCLFKYFCLFNVLFQKNFLQMRLIQHCESPCIPKWDKLNDTILAYLFQGVSIYAIKRIKIKKRYLSTKTCHGLIHESKLYKPLRNRDQTS